MKSKPPYGERLFGSPSHGEDVIVSADDDDEEDILDLDS